MDEAQCSWVSGSRVLSADPYLFSDWSEWIGVSPTRWSQVAKIQETTNCTRWLQLLRERRSSWLFANAWPARLSESATRRKRKTLFSASYTSTKTWKTSSRRQKAESPFIRLPPLLLLLCLKVTPTPHPTGHITFIFRFFDIEIQRLREKSDCLYPWEQERSEKGRLPRACQRQAPSRETYRQKSPHRLRSHHGKLRTCAGTSLVLSVQLQEW